jgi:hypothetical protein
VRAIVESEDVTPQVPVSPLGGGSESAGNSLAKGIGSRRQPGRWCGWTSVRTSASADPSTTG